MDVSTPPSLDPACPQAVTDIEKYVHMFRDRGVDEIKYEHEGIMIILRTITYIYIYCHMISYAQVIIYSPCQVWIKNFIVNQQTIISVVEAIAIYHNIGKSQYKSFSASPHTQLPFSLSQLLTLTQYLWVWNFNRTQRKIGAYSFACQRFTSRVMSTIIVHENSHPISHIYQDLSNILCLPKDKM